MHRFVFLLAALLVGTAATTPGHASKLDEKLDQISAVYERGHLDSALALCQVALAKWPDSIRLHDFRINLAGDDRVALRRLVWQYKQALAKKPKDKLAKLLYGLAAYTEEPDSGRFAI